MVRWRHFLILALLLLLPVRIGCEEDESDEDNDNENSDDDDNDDDSDPTPIRESGRRAPAILQATLTTAAATRAVLKRPLECFVCSYKPDAYFRSCLDPTKFRVHTMACHSVEEKCFTAVTSKGNNYESVIRGCRSSCVGTPETTCCSMDRCNMQPFGVPVVPPRVQVMSPQPNSGVMTYSKSNKAIPPSVLFFVTILLVLQTVVKVAVV